MAVLPAYQRRGIGSQLVEAGFTACHHTSYGVVVVLGHPHYYPRFGFAPAKPLGIVWEHDVSEEAFMVKEIQEGALAHTRGVVKYRPEFDVVSPEEEAIMLAKHDSLALLHTTRSLSAVTMLCLLSCATDHYVFWFSIQTCSTSLQSIWCRCA
jgi:hypothetical protein